LSKLEIDIEIVKRLVDLVDKHHLEELTVEHSDIAITVKGKNPRQNVPITIQGGALPSAQGAVVSSEEFDIEGPEELEEEATVEETGKIVDITAPLVGVFYRAPAPDEPPLVEVGDVIAVGSRIGLLEAMKVFNEVPSEVAGEVIAIPAENGKLVREGDVLVRVRVEE
jgi:acetyl-CoA carboxylase biotin carboxyl carrier protein